MKISQFGRDVSDTGGGRVIMEISRHMALQGHDVLIVTDVEVTRETTVGMKVKTMPLGMALKNWTPSLRITTILRQFCRMLAFTIYGSITSLRLSREGWITLNHNIEYLGGDIIVLHNVFSHEHKSDPRGARKHLRWVNPVFLLRITRERLAFLFYRNRCWIAVSETTREEVAPYLGHCNTLFHINNGVNADAFSPLPTTERETKKQSTHEHKKFTLLFVGYEFERKGLAYIIEALSLLPENVHLKVIGGRLSTQATYEHLAKRLGVSGRVAFLGSIPSTTEHYQLADALILPSTYETWALVGLEAMACGTPTLMTEVGGIPAYLNDGENGFFIKQDANDIAEKVKIMLNNPNLAEKMRAHARNAALKHSWSEAAEKYIQVAKMVHEKVDRTCVKP
jgi:glycosyltransferase involved in cell wall biosynthesis